MEDEMEDEVEGNIEENIEGTFYFQLDLHSYAHI